MTEGSRRLPVHAGSRVRKVFVKFAVVLAALGMPAIAIGLAVPMSRGPGAEPAGYLVAAGLTVAAGGLLTASAVTARRSIIADTIQIRTIDRADALARAGRIVALVAAVAGLATAAATVRSFAGWAWLASLVAAAFWPALAWLAGGMLRRAIAIARKGGTAA